MREETQKVVRGVAFGCIFSILSTLFLINKFDLSQLWAVLLGIIFMVVGVIAYDPKDTWKIVKEASTWQPNKIWWKLLKLHFQGQGAIMLALSSWVLVVIMSIFGLVVSGLIPITIKVTFAAISMILTAILIGYLIGTSISAIIQMNHPLLGKTGIKKAEDDRDFSYAEAKEIYYSLIMSPAILLIWVFTTIVRTPNWWCYSGKPFICKVFTRLATSGREVTFWCTGIGFATGVSYGLITGVEYLAPTLIGTITGIAIAVVSVDIIPIRMLRLQVR